MIKLSEEQKMVYDDLSMAEKIAILLIQLGEDITTSLFSHMEINPITEISRYIAQAKKVDKAVATAVLEEFYSILQSNQFIKTGGFDYAKELLFKTFGPEMANKILEKLTKSMETRIFRIWDRLNRSNLRILSPKNTHKLSRSYSRIWTQCILRRLWSILTKTNALMLSSEWRIWATFRLLSLKGCLLCLKNI